MPEKMPQPESLPPQETSPEVMSELEEEITRIINDIERIEQGTKVALKKFNGAQRKIGVEPDNQVEEKHE